MDANELDKFEMNFPPSMYCPIRVLSYCVMLSLHAYSIAIYDIAGGNQSRKSNISIYIAQHRSSQETCRSTRIGTHVRYVHTRMHNIPPLVRSRI